MNIYLSRHNECEVPDCNNHGECQAGVCVCSRGYTGLFCQQGKIRKDCIKVSLINETMTKQQFGKCEVLQPYVIYIHCVVLYLVLEK